MKRVVISAMALTLASVTSNATANEFSGFRLEAQLLNDKVTSTEVETYKDGSDWRDVDKNSRWGYGLGIGYDHAISSNVIAGIEANVNFADTADSGFEGYLGDGIEGDNMEMIREFDASARLGYVVVPGVLVYGKAGYAVSRMRFDVEQYDYDDDSYLDLGQRTYNRGGLRLGVGAEVNITKNVFTKLEYRYTKYNKWNGYQRDDYYDGTETVEDNYHTIYKFSRQQIGASVGVRF